MARPMLDDESCRRHGWWLLLIVAAVLYLPGTGVLPLMDRDEPRFARATVEMMERGTWTIPWFNGEYRFDKPPLTYWWMRLHYHLLGVSELAARLHSVAATGLAALAIFAFGVRLGSGRAGLAAGFAWLTTLQVLVHGRLCVADMPMVLCVILACRALFELLVAAGAGNCQAGEVAEHGPSTRATASTPGRPRALTRWFWVLWISLGLGFLAKGPVAWLVPGLALVLWRFLFWRQGAPWARLRVLPGLAVALAIIASWGVPALIETRGAFWSVGIGEHVVKRGTDVLNGRSFVPGYYFATAFASLFPWIGFLPVVWRRLRAGMSATSAFLLAWLAAPYLIFFFYATQLPHYVMPGFPAFLLLAALSAESFLAHRHDKWSFATVIFACFLLLGAASKLASRHPAVGSADVAGLLDAAGSLLIVLALLGAFSWWKHALSLPLAASCVLALATVIRDAAAAIRAAHPVIALPRDDLVLDAGAQRIACQFTEPSLVFYAGAPWKFANKLSSADAAFSKPGAKVLVLLKQEWTLDGWLRRKTGRSDKPPGAADRDLTEEVEALIAKHPKATVTELTGLNLARSSLVRIVLLQKKE